jgi:hypothetical protein
MSVIAGLAPAIHDLVRWGKDAAHAPCAGVRGSDPWMAGTRPVMTMMGREG